jgi:hypothetical protein
MTTFYIDPVTHDLDFSSGTVRWCATDSELIRQSVQIALSTYRGEWFANVNFGPPYLENENNKIQIIGKVSKNIFDSYIKETILAEDGVAQIQDYVSKLDLPTGHLTVTCKIIKTNGGIVPITIGVEV